MKCIVIMAGGAGERFWPLSRSNHPKQLLRLTGSGQSLLEEAVERSKAIVPAENIYIATAQHLQEPIRQAKLGLPDENIIAEPCKRNTAGCLIYATATILARTGKAPEEVTMGVLTADHRIPDTVPFVATVSRAMDAAEAIDSLITIGIQPIRADTAYGYIEVPAKDKPQDAPDAIYPVASFHEKPTPEKAAQYVASGRFFWNSGMFFWRICSFMSEFGQANPVMAETLEDLTDALLEGSQERAAKIFDALPNISIDYALMEKAKNVKVIPGNFVWDDLGSWDSLDRTFPKDQNGNVAIGNPYLVDTSNTIVYNAVGDEKMAVGVLGMKDVVVIVRDDAVLVMPKDRAQDVKKLVVDLHNRNAKQL
ncbi:MAG: mannose-1-phosphate guanylyltransferase [Victivallales bacterium]|nr:mannose-1-phosphate guanylyltransferase [Victivallales bacterium]